MEKKDIVLGMKKDLSVINNSNSPDEMFSFACGLMHHTIEVIAEYGVKMNEPEMQDKQKTKEHMMDILNAYDLVEAGMDAEEVLDVLNLDAKILNGEVYATKHQEKTE